jgi:chemotaxis protein methyltransferase CheR
MMTEMESTQKMTPEELELFNELLSSAFGLCFAEEKREILESRLRPRLHAIGLKRFRDYYTLLQINPNGEIFRLSQLVTNNETYFFRETQQFECLFGEALESLKSESVSPDALRILCAGCSSGEEPYTLNIFAKENLYRMWGRTVTINAFDIDRGRLALARGGVYGRNSFRFTTPEQTNKYFRKLAEDSYQIKEMYRSPVRFSEGNVMDLSSYGGEAPYDAIFCRNVLIYFAEPSLQKAVYNFAQCLRPGGLLFLGHSESIIGMSPLFQSVRLGDCIAYRRIAP